MTVPATNSITVGEKFSWYDYQASLLFDVLVDIDEYYRFSKYNGISRKKQSP